MLYMNNKVLLIFHNLNIEGAPTMLINAAKILVEAGYSVEALSLENGVYKEKLKQLNIPIRILKGKTNIVTDQYIKQFNLVIANTVITFSVIARYNNTVPIMWYIHEGKTIKNIFARNIAVLDALIRTKTHIVVVSEYVKEWLEKEYVIQDISVLHNFIDEGKDKEFVSNTLTRINRKSLFYIFPLCVTLKKKGVFHYVTYG